MEWISGKRRRGLEARGPILRGFILEKYAKYGTAFLGREGGYGFCLDGPDVLDLLERDWVLGVGVEWVGVVAVALGVQKKVDEATRRGREGRERGRAGVNARAMGIVSGFGRTQGWCSVWEREGCGRGKKRFV